MTDHDLRGDGQQKYDHAVPDCPQWQVICPACTPFKDKFCTNPLSMEGYPPCDPGHIDCPDCHGVLECGDCPEGWQ